MTNNVSSGSQNPKNTYTVKLSINITGVFNTVRPSALVDNTARWSLFRALDRMTTGHDHGTDNGRRTTDDGQTDVSNQRISGP